jgi:fumarylacetoacetase
MTTPWMPDAEAGTGFGIDNLPFGVFVRAPGAASRVGTRIGKRVVDLSAVAAASAPQWSALFAQPSLNDFLRAGPALWREVREALTTWFTDERYRPAVESASYDAEQVTMLLPIDIGDYVDFYSSEHHARNVGAILRPGSGPLPSNWKHLPIGYHGRAGTIVVSGTPIARPAGLSRPAPNRPPVFGPSARLDIEAEVGFVIGGSTSPGSPVTLDQFGEVVFGVCLVNDWSARDIQAFEYVPLGPFLGKSFATSLAPWVVPLQALDAAWVSPPERDVKLAAYLADRGLTGGLDIELSVHLNGEQISAPRFASMYWTPAQQLAHLTVNGASVRPGDLYASGTVSGPSRNERGSLLELTWNGTQPLHLADGSTRAFLEDGDDVRISARAPSSAGHVSFGEVSGRVVTQGTIRAATGSSAEITLRGPGEWDAADVRRHGSERQAGRDGAQ